MSVKKPTGITISRSGRTIKAKWVKRDKYSTTQYYWCYTLVSEKGNTIHHYIIEKYGTTDGVHAQISIPSNRTCNEVQFEVRGKKSGKWSAWAKKTYKMYEPRKPSLTAEFIQHAMTKFTWSPVTDKHERPISDTYLQTILVQDCPSGEEAIASLPQWKDKEQNPIQSKASSGSITPVNGAGEDTSVITGKSYTRIVRVKQIGIAGETDWKYAKHIYADPYPAENISGVVTKTEASLNCEMSWTTPTDAGHPIDKDGVIPQWSISTPDVGMVCRDDATFNSLSPMASTANTEKRRFTLDTPIGVDKCLYLRVVTLHDETDVEHGVISSAVLASGDFAGALGNPVFSAAPSIQGNNVTIQATNGSEVPDSFVVDFLERPDGTVEVLGLQDLSSKTYTVDNIENARVGLKAYVGDWDSTLKEVQNVLMESPMVWWSGGSVPEAPSLDDFKIEQSIVPNTVNVTWRYSWDDADACEISWSTEPDAWISTEDPDSYIVLRGLEDKLAIKGIEAGVPLYVRIRYLNGVDEDAILSPYSDIKSITVSTVPAVPTLTLEKQFFTKGEEITCSWIYVTTDGTEQAQAQIAEQIGVTQQGEPIFGEPIKVVTTEQKTVIPNTWEVGTQHAIAVSVANGSGNWSKWSNAVMVTIAEPIVCTITDADLVAVSEGYELQQLPFHVTVEGAGVGGQTILIIRRAEDYPLERPEGDNYKGFKGETVFQNIYTGEDEQTITLGDVTDLDDGAKYELYASVEDDYGQTDNDAIEFTVNWNHKAVMPSATVEVTDIATIEIAESESAEEGDYVDIYRRSIDGTELIYTVAEYGGTYVDPYPTIGNFGYLLVGRNMYGDYIMATVEDDEGQFAWFDLPASYENDKTLIDFDGEQIQLYYNVDVSHSWNKDFKKTKYLGGSIIGDYVAGVERTGNVNFVSIPMVEEDMLASMRRLAEYEGNCHIRTVEGSSFTACIQVSEEDNHDKAGLVRNFSMTVDKVEPTTLDGMSEEDWEAQNAVE